MKLKLRFDERWADYVLDDESTYPDLMFCSEVARETFGATSEYIVVKVKEADRKKHIGNGWHRVILDGDYALVETAQNDDEGRGIWNRHFVYRNARLALYPFTNPIIKVKELKDE